MASNGNGHLNGHSNGHASVHVNVQVRGDDPTAPLPPGVVDIRTMIPKLGLKEYWYPALRDWEVKDKPVFLKLLGVDLVAFRGKSGEISIFHNACPHRGAFLSEGSCTFRGFLTCFYHGYTFDEKGECVAVLGEGPESPMVGKVHARVFPTVTLKGVVFVWMGDGEPCSLQEGVPEEFLDDDALVLNWTTVWKTNWRPALENVADSHFRLLHKNAVRVLMRPFPGPAWPRGRGAPQIINNHRLRASGQSDEAPAMGVSRRKPGDPRQYYVGVDAKWPKTNYRRFWTWIFDWGEKRRLRRPYVLSQEWGPGEHLPGMFRQNYWTYVFTRWVIAIDEETSLLFYFHSAKPSNWIGRVYERIHFNLIGGWLQNQNFSEQDGKGSIMAYHNTREHLSPSDLQTMMWRKFILTARGLKQEKDAKLEGAADILDSGAASSPTAVGEGGG